MNNKGTKLLKEGDVLPYKYGKFQVIEYQGCKKVKVRFLDEFSHERFVAAGDAVLGKISNPFARSCCGLGYIGVGEYRPKTHKYEYTLWTSMFSRCYNTNERSLSYQNKEVKEVWYNFQNFAEWCQQQVGFKQPKWQLDKDILVKGNTFYGPDTCCFVPQRVNLLLVKADAKRGEYPLGVCKSGKWFHVNCGSKEDGSNSYVGIYDNLEDAVNAYKTRKEEIIKTVANIYKDLLDIRVYEALMLYEVSVSD